MKKGGINNDNQQLKFIATIQEKIFFKEETKWKVTEYATNWRNERYHKKMQNCINDFLGTNFSEEDFETIYVVLGNAINHEKTMEFIKSGYNFKVLN